jgi:hypothetical protein
MGFDFAYLKALGQVIVTIGSSIYDIGTDIVSAYTYLDGQSIARNETSFANGSRFQTEGTEKQTHVLWGSCMVFILFMPGLFWACRPSKLSWFKRLLGLFFPFYAIGYGISALGNPQDPMVNKKLAVICACEALFESFPQIVMTVYTFMFVSTEIQLITQLQTAGSVILLAKGIIDFDLIGGDVKFNGIKDTILYLMKLIPLYAVGTFFRLASLTITLIYLRQWAIIPTIFLFAMMVVLVGSCIAWDKDVIYNMALTNMSVANVGMVRMKQLNLEDDEINNWKPENDDLPKDIAARCQRFIQVSSYVTFLHHSCVLLVVLYLVCNGSPILPDINELQHWLRPTAYISGTRARWVYITFSSTIMIGTLDVLITSCTSKNIKFGEDTEPTTNQKRVSKQELNREFTRRPSLVRLEDVAAFSSKP